MSAPGYSSDSGEASRGTELQNSAVPSTPVSSDPSNSLVPLSSPSISVSRSFLSSSRLEKGTPLAIGAFKTPRSLSQIVTPLPSHSRQPSKLCASFTPSSPLIQGSSIHVNRGEVKDNGTENDSTSDEDSEREEARLLLDVARAQRQVRQLEQDIILAQLDENAAIGELYRFRADQAQKKLDTTECDLGYLRNAIRKNGISLADLPSTRKRRRMSSDVSHSEDQTV